MGDYYVEIAGIKIKIIASIEVLKAIAKDLGGEVSDENIQSDLIVSFNSDNFKSYKPTVYSAKGSMNFNNTDYFVAYLILLCHT